MKTQKSKMVVASLVTALLLSLSVLAFADTSGSGESSGQGKKHGHWKHMKGSVSNLCQGEWDHPSRQRLRRKIEHRGSDGGSCVCEGVP